MKSEGPTIGPGFLVLFVDRIDEIVYEGLADAVRMGLMDWVAIPVTMPARRSVALEVQEDADAVDHDGKLGAVHPNL